jgi:aquaporin NIP
MKKYMAEFMATFVLIFCGTGAAIVNEVRNGVITHVGIAMVFGLIVMAMIYAFGEMSGSHMNPAVTIAFAVQKVFPATQLIPYIVSQVAGAVAASYCLKFLFPGSQFLGATIPSGSIMQSWVLEFFLTFILMLTVLNVADKGKEKGLLAGLAIGAVVLVEAMFAGPISGASMNPARSFAPALVSGNVQYIWIYVTAPIAGSISSVFIFRLMN